MNARLVRSVSRKCRYGRLLCGLLAVSLVGAVVAGASVADAALTASQQAQLKEAVLANPEGGEALEDAINAILIGVSASAAPAVVADIIAVISDNSGETGAFSTAREVIATFVTQVAATGASRSAVVAIQKALESAMLKSRNGKGNVASLSSQRDRKTIHPPPAPPPPPYVPGPYPGAPPIPPCTTNSMGECLE